jgi:hypothetical protein
MLSLVNALALSIAVVTSDGQATESQRRADLVRQSLTLSVHAERQQYLEAEPVAITIRATNRTAQLFRGAFHIHPVMGGLQLWVRRDGESFRRLAYLEQKADYAGGSTDIPAHGEVTAHLVLCFDPGSSAFLFGEPGTYEIKATYVDWPGTALVLESAIESIEIVTASEERSAMQAFTGRVALVAQFGSESSEPPPTTDALREAEQYLADYPESHYAGELRRGLENVLHYRLGGGRGTPEDTAALRRLHERSRP